MEEVSAHCATDDFGVPHVNGPRKSDGGCRAKRGRGADQGSDVSGILDAVEDEESRGGRRRKVMQRTLGGLGNHQDALRGFGLGDAFEIRGRELLDLDGARRQRIAERDAARGRRELGGSQRANDSQRGLRELLRGTHALDDKQRVSLARFPTAEVAR